VRRIEGEPDRIAAETARASASSRARLFAREDAVGPDFVPEAPAEADRNLMTRGRPWLRLALEAPTSDPSVCGWTVDGVAVRALVAIPDSLAGRIVVVRVVRTSVAWSCSDVMSPCPVSYALVVTDIVVGG
jgi:hypothetical protein